MASLPSIIRPALLIACLLPTTLLGEWDQDAVWHDGLVEKAVYDATRVIYGKARTYEAIFFTNKEQHDVKTWTKAARSTETIEVWKHNVIEVIPTPNYDYKYVTTTHLVVDGLTLTRLDAASQEFCGASFKQYLRHGMDNAWDYTAFSYLPEQGKQAARIEAANLPVVPADALPLYLRAFDFAGRGEIGIALLPDQTSNTNVAFQPTPVTVRFAGEDGEAFQVEVVSEGQVIGTYWMAKDRLHVMTRYRSADGAQEYVLKDLARVDYWTRDEQP